MYENEKNNVVIPKKQEQITFAFEEKEDKLKEELDKIDILKITPIDAINILYKLKEMEK